MNFKQSLLRYSFLLQLLICLVCFPSCNNNETAKQKEDKSDSLSDAQQRLPENALKGLTVAKDVQVKTMATEPMLKNPTNIDVDERGRVWVNEAYNYRPAINGNPVNALGDRIMILEDTNGDGIADTAKVFYQGPELDAPLGICVLGNRVIVSQSPYVWAFYDDDGDDKADRKEILFQGISGEQHDHGVHAFTFGADGKLYFNMGNAGEQLRDKNNKPVLDQDGDVISQKKYRQGMVFRCDLDGSHVECLGQNFRNPYEVAVDSYGTLWQSDNDDDGNRGTRINYVMQYGNYGYTDEITGAGWQGNRTNIEDSIPLRHWHLNDPGTVPNMLQTFAGSPTGILVYEGSLLPKEFHDQLIHCDAGTNVVRSYTVANAGAGYNASIINILKGEKDQWFRPADVCTAPDGSIIVADWYDPGVGGHQAGDQTRGRIYRVAQDISTYKISKEDYSTAAGAVAALQNPNLSVRYHAFTALQQMGAIAVPELEKLWHNTNADPRMRARAFWVLVKMPKTNAAQYIQEAIKDNNPDLRITAIRAAHELNANDVTVIRALVNVPDAQVRRECALALHHNKNAEAASLWTTLASQYDGKDRWYLEALGIGADKQWDKFFAAYLDKVNDPLQTAASKDIVWRARTDAAIPYLATLASDKQTDLSSRLKYFRAFDFETGSLKSKLLLKMIEDNTSNDIALNKLVLHALDIKTVTQSPVAQKALADVLQSVAGTDEYIELVSRYEVRSQNNNLLQLAINKPHEGVGRNAAGLLLHLGGASLVSGVFNGKDAAQKDSLLISLAGVGSKESIDILQNIALSNKYDIAVRKSAAHKIGNSWSGEDRVLEILKAKKVPAELIPDVVASVDGAWRGSVRSEAASYLPDNGKSKTSKPAPTMQEIAALTPNAAEGQKIFANTCSVCHMVNNIGNDFGPKLSEIGSKLPKEALLEAIVNPSAGIGFGYEGWEVKMKDGSTMSGIIASKTETDIDIKFPGGARKQIKTADVLALTQMKTSMMTDGLYQNMSTQDLANLLDYLESLKKK
ncbi:c-type cytochrome [Panacibacter ginsenosidivorans]|uniref:C-type cytochrome n=1 Tax=Panacibacter ginsenosidivorans TaxID=1813871 RepID=A0A5B8V770_9BACT|nr:PVC-type heme-binding CxxCH protein [Panacibacter ginsenosidivorans]QEC67162.1 c-type cytochrome [Panacibacter ginsenosidivorans]